jgi:DNA repair protein RecN (Recombination protein N)
MLQSLYIQNYALIDDLKIDFENGFSIITGETGAGKSILLGALSLLVGQRADASVLLDKSKKCIVEGVFNIREYNLKEFFAQNELDYDNSVIIRREILDNGRSRAFVNDSPVNLNILKDLGERLIDIHSQHQNSYLADSQFQLKVIDILSKNGDLLDFYKNSFKKHGELLRTLLELQEKSAKGKADYDYFNFLYNELEAARLLIGEQAELEEEIKILSHSEEIKSTLTNILGLLSAESIGILAQLKETVHLSGKIKSIFHKISTLQERLESSFIELKDITSEAENLSESIDLDPLRLQEVNSRLDTLYSLCQKHRVSNSDELISLRDDIKQKVSTISGYDEQIDVLSKQLKTENQILVDISVNLDNSRRNAILPFEQNIINIIRQLGMPYAGFSVKLEKTDGFTISGCNKTTFLFSANKQVPLQDISRVASGGETSRVMLAIKSVISVSLAMPAVIFDEIDAGVSGDIADKVGNIMQQMANSMQVISITHLPQVASKGKNHYLVFKIEEKDTSKTRMKLLKGEDRVVEIAKMLSGEQISEAAITNARVLLNN